MRLLRSVAYMVVLVFWAGCGGGEIGPTDSGTPLGMYWNGDSGTPLAGDAGTTAAPADAGTGSQPRDAGTVIAPVDAGTAPAADAGGIITADAGVKAPKIDSFTGSPDNIAHGSPATLQWVLSGGAPTTLKVGTTDVSGSNSSVVSPTAASTTYTLTASNAAGTATKSVTIKVESTEWPYIDARKIPAAQPGWSTARVEPTSMTIGAGDPNSVGAFRLGCFFANMNFDDPILYAKQPGAAPLHVSFGNVGVDAWSTDTSIQNAGNSTCSGGILNRTGYWAPAIIDTTDGTPVAAASMLVYYKTGYGGVKAADVKPVPVGLHMVTGNANGSSAANTSSGRFSCVGGDVGVGWQTTLPTTCNQGNSMIFEIAFDQCWDGVNLDSIDHRSHMAGTTGTGCPPTHPVALPEITYEVYYDLSKVDIARMAKWRLASDHYDPSTPAGYSANGGYYYGWDKATMQKFITNCDNPGADCHANLLGDGTWLY